MSADRILAGFPSSESQAVTREELNEGRISFQNAVLCGVLDGAARGLTIKEAVDTFGTTKNTFLKFASRVLEPNSVNGEEHTAIKVLVHKLKERDLDSEGIVPDDIKMPSPRELEVLKHMSFGETDNQIASSFRISARTVREFKQNLFVKIKAKTRMQAVAIGVVSGILDGETIEEKTREVQVPISIPDLSQRVKKLSPRELEVFANSSTGLSNDNIAKLLNISSHTVRAYLRRIFMILGVENRVQLAILAHDFVKSES